MRPALISSTRINPATSGNPQARGPAACHHCVLPTPAGGRTPVPVRSAVAQTPACQLEPEGETFQQPYSVLRSALITNIWWSDSGSGSAWAGIGMFAVVFDPCQP